MLHESGFFFLCDRYLFHCTADTKFHIFCQIKASTSAMSNLFYNTITFFQNISDQTDHLPLISVRQYLCLHFLLIWDNPVNSGLKKQITYSQADIRDLPSFRISPIIARPVLFAKNFLYKKVRRI